MSMDAVMYLKEKTRMCHSDDGPYKCDRCSFFADTAEIGCVYWEETDPAEAVRIVEEWSNEHPIQTNGQKFVEVFGFEPTTWNKMCEDIHDFITDPQWWHEPYEAPKGD